jgi:hypothetical protein
MRAIFPAEAANRHRGHPYVDTSRLGALQARRTLRFVELVEVVAAAVQERRGKLELLVRQLVDQELSRLTSELVRRRRR